MVESQLASFLRDAGNRPYREFVQHHLRRNSEHELRNATMGEIQSLPIGLQPHVIDYIDAINARLAHDHMFWVN